MIRLLVLTLILATASLASSDLANRILPEVQQIEVEDESVVAETGSDDGTNDFDSTTTLLSTSLGSGSGVAPSLIPSPTPTPTPSIFSGSPTPTPTPTPTGSSSGSGEECHDLKVNGSEWHDSYSEEYNCNWYSDDGNCQAYGDSYEYDGYTANEACCACGGGTTSNSEEEMLYTADKTTPNHILMEASEHTTASTSTASGSVTPTPTASSGSGSTSGSGFDEGYDTSGSGSGYDEADAYPTVQPTSNDDETCKDYLNTNGTEWHDSDGAVYNCDWYSNNTANCDAYGNSFECEGYSADEACCACGGGSTGTDTGVESTDEELLLALNTATPKIYDTTAYRINDEEDVIVQE